MEKKIPTSANNLEYPPILGKMVLMLLTAFEFQQDASELSLDVSLKMVVKLVFITNQDVSKKILSSVYAKML